MHAMKCPLGRGVTSLSPSPPLGPKTNNPSESNSGEQVGDPSEPITSAEDTADTVEPQQPSFSEDAPRPPVLRLLIHLPIQVRTPSDAERERLGWDSSTR
jgi:hypothetical protein